MPSINWCSIYTECWIRMSKVSLECESLKELEQWAHYGVCRSLCQVSSDGNRWRIYSAECNRVIDRQGRRHQRRASNLRPTELPFLVVREPPSWYSGWQRPSVRCWRYAELQPGRLLDSTGMKPAHTGISSRSYRYEARYIVFLVWSHLAGGDIYWWW